MGRTRRKVLGGIADFIGERWSSARSCNWASDSRDQRPAVDLWGWYKSLLREEHNALVN